jgi:Tfp pilus assembly protein PilO
MKNLLSKLAPQDKKKMSLVFLASLIVFYLFYSFLINGQLQSIKQKGPQIIKLKTSLDTFTKEFAQMQELKNKQVKLDALSLVKKIISEEEKVSLLRNISDIANKNNIQIIELRHAEESQSPKQEKTAAAVKAQPLLITLDLSCDYHSLGKFINDLENAQTFMAVQSMKITTQATDYLKQKVNLVLRTYVRK